MNRTLPVAVVEVVNVVEVVEVVDEHPVLVQVVQVTSAIAGTEKDNIATIIAATATTNRMRLISATSYVSWRSALDRSYYSRDYLSGSGSGVGKSSQEGMGVCPTCPVFCHLYSIYCR